MRVCKVCNEEKELEKFVKQKNFYRYKCKECRQKERKTGRPRASFKKGNIPWNKDKKGLNFANNGSFKKGIVPWNKGKKTGISWNRGKNPEKRYNKFYDEWILKVKERDGSKCVKCGSDKKIHAHHIIPWKEDESKRFDLDNGISLCASCHGKLEGFQKGHIAWAKGKKFTENHREKLRQSHLKCKSKVSLNDSK